MQIEPYVTIDSLRLGESTREDGIASYGEPRNVRMNRQGVEEFHDDDFILRFDPAAANLRECTLLPEKEATIRDISVTWDWTFLRMLCASDGNPLESYGFLIFPTLGIAVTGIHDSDRSQLAVTVFSKGDFDEWIDAATPFDVESDVR